MKGWTGALGGAALALVAGRALAADQGSQPTSGFVRPSDDGLAAATAPCVSEFPSRMPIRCWLGQKFVFLPMAKEIQHYGYQEVDGGDGDYGHPAYDELAGKIATVTALTPIDESVMSGWQITFTLDSGRSYTTKALALEKSEVDDVYLMFVAPVRDLLAARERFLGKRYWITVGTLPALTNGGELVSFPKFSIVSISDVLASTTNSEPVRLVIKNPGGEEAALDVQLSGTNQPKSLVKTGDPLDGYLADHDPLAGKRWSPRVIAAIKAQKVIVGMTKEQATMSWGAPDDINRTIGIGQVKEQWVYGEGSYLYFEGNVLTAIQN